MLDDLKKDRQTGFGAQERLKLSMYVGGMLILGLLIYAGTRSGDLDGKGKTPAEDEEPSAAPTPTLDRKVLHERVTASKAAPDRWAAGGIEYMREIARAGSLGPVEAHPRAAELAAGRLVEDAAPLRGRMLEVLGRVIEVSREEYRPTADATGNGRLWSVVMEGADGTQFVAVKYALASDVGEGPPLDTKPPLVKADAIQKDHWVRVRGVYFQDRVGTLGRIQLNDQTPALFASQWRIVLPPEQHNPLISRLDEALWSQVGDRFNRESRNWEEDAVYETIQWARHHGYAKIKALIESGELPWEIWGRDRFQRWKKEVGIVTEDDPRPITEGSRGKVFRMQGVIGEVLQYGWERIPRNPWGVDEFQILTMLSDHYRTVAFRSFLPYPIDSFEGITGKREENIYVYGVFVKNLTYDTRFKHEDGSGRARPVTMPMFVVLHAEPFPKDAASNRIRDTMVWVAGAMVIFGLLFYFVLIRGGRAQVKRMEAHRLDLRRRARAKGQGPTAGRPAATGSLEDPPADADG